MSVTFYSEGVDMELNFSNANTRAILKTLLIDNEELIGRIQGTELADRCEKAKIDLLDEGKPVTEYRSPGHATIIDCGRRPGYFNDVLNLLMRLGHLAGEKVVSYC